MQTVNVELDAVAAVLDPRVVDVECVWQWSLGVSPGDGVERPRTCHEPTRQRVCIAQVAGVEERACAIVLELEGLTSEIRDVLGMLLMPLSCCHCQNCRSTLAWWHQKIGSNDDLYVAIVPLTQLWSRLCGCSSALLNGTNTFSSNALTTVLRRLCKSAVEPGWRNVGPLRSGSWGQL